MTQINRLLYGLHRSQTWKGTADISWDMETLCLLEVLERALNWTLERDISSGVRRQAHIPGELERSEMANRKPGAFMSCNRPAQQSKIKAVGASEGQCELSELFLPFACIDHSRWVVPNAFISCLPHLPDLYEDPHGPPWTLAFSRKQSLLSLLFSS